VTEIQEKVIKQSRRNAASRLLHARNDKETIAGWKSELNSILNLFTVCSVALAWSPLSVLLQAELVMNIHVNVSEIRGNMSKIREEIRSQAQPVSASCT
jgi:hypothetical protein